MKTYLWKKKIELKKSIPKCILLIIFPLIIGGVYTKAFPLNQQWLYFMYPVTVSVLIYYITYNVDDIACAGTYALVGISPRTMWISGITFCTAAGYIMSVLYELLGAVLRLISFDTVGVLLTLMSIPCTFSLLGLSTIHYLTNSRKQLLVASFFSIVCLMRTPITILINIYLPIAKLSVVMYGVISVVFLAAAGRTSNRTFAA